MRRRIAQALKTACLVFHNVFFVNGVSSLVPGRLSLGRRVHTAKMLGKKVFAIEVIVVNCLVIIGVGGCSAKIAAPEAEFNVLGAHMPFPLVLGLKSGLATVHGERA